MDEYPVKYAVSRYQREWDGVTLTGVQQREDGALTLAQVPAPIDGNLIALAAPFDVDPSGISVGRSNDLYVSDTVNNTLVFTDEICAVRVVLPSCNGSGNALGQFNTPRGLLIGPPGGLYVSDSGNSRIQVFRLPTLELHAVWDQPLQEPTCLAADSQNRVYVLDRGLSRVLRFNAWGVSDDAYNAATMAQPPTLTAPFSLAVGAHDTLYVTNDHSNSVLSFDLNGKALGTLPTNASASPAKPRALAAHRHRLYVADANIGQIWIYDCISGVYIGTAANFRGPVASMTVDHAGATLYVKPGSGQDILKLQTLAAYIPSGTLVTGPLDAGENSEWERAHVKAEIPAGSTVRLRTFVSDNSTTVPTFKDWGLALDTLVPPLPGIGNCQPGQKRYLWMQVQLNSANQRATPVLLQVQAQTTGESYLDHLPAVYRKEDLPRRFLERWLALFRSELGDLELLLEDMPRLFDPVTTPEEYLQWLASWLAFEFPEGKSTREKRLLLARAHELYARRGTPSGIREFIELYADARAHLFEAFRQRHVWQLGTTSALGFDTALAPSAPNGMIVAGLVPPDPQYFGLHGEYFSGPNFDVLKTTRTDPMVDFVWQTAPSDPAIPAIGKFSVRWTGQIQPRYSERYSFHILAIGGVRLWIDDELIIDTWKNPQSAEAVGRIALTAGRWYSLRLEYYGKILVSVADAGVHLSWSSRSQLKEIIPQSRLYSILDDTVDLDVPPQTPGCGTLMVGQTVVGESGPLQASQFGTPFLSDTAHLFTVSVPAARVRRLAQRQELKRVVEAEKPAHTDFHLCFVKPRMRVGFQSSLGIDTIVAGPSEPMSLMGTWLGLDSVLGAEQGDGEAGRVGKRARVGQSTVLG